MLAGSASRVLARLLLGSEGLLHLCPYNLLQLLVLWRRFEHLSLERLAILPLLDLVTSAESLRAYCREFDRLTLGGGLNIFRWRPPCREFACSP